MITSSTATLTEAVIVCPKGWMVYQPGGKSWVRTDGAVVRFDDSAPNPNPSLPGARMYTAWAPGREDLSIKTTNGRVSWPRRWKNPTEAMKAVDRKWPVKS